MINPKEQPRYFFDHLVELRKGLIHSLVYTTLGIGLAFWKSGLLFNVLLHPLQRVMENFPLASLQVGGLQTLVPVEAFMINMKLATAAGLILASPFILWEAWNFISPALKFKERGAILMVFCLGLIFFTAGAAFSYFLVIPMALHFLVQYNLEYHFIPRWTLQGYFNFTVNFTLIFGLIFEFPLVLAALAAIGIVTPEFMAQKRRMAVMGIFILAVALAPSADPITMLVVAMPMVVLYELGIGMSRLVFFRRKKREEAKRTGSVEILK